MTIKREYVSKHVYKTPSGQFWDDRKGKRITDRRGRSIERNTPKQRERMNARFRDKSGRLTFRKVKGSSDIRKKTEKGKHTGSPGEEEFEGESIYDPRKNQQYANEYVERRLNEEDAEIWHFNVHELETLEE